MAAYTDAKTIIGALLMVIKSSAIRSATPNFFMRKYRKDKRALKIVDSEIAVVNLRANEQRCGGHRGGQRTGDIMTAPNTECFSVSIKTMLGALPASLL
jgi:hypothetical protein